MSHRFSSAAVWRPRRMVGTSCAAAATAAATSAAAASRPALSGLQFIAVSSLSPRFPARTSERNHQPFELGLAIDEVDALRSDPERAVGAHEAMEIGARKDALNVAPILGHHELGAHDRGAGLQLDDRGVG